MSCTFANSTATYRLCELPTPWIGTVEEYMFRVRIADLPTCKSRLFASMYLLALTRRKYRIHGAGTLTLTRLITGSEQPSWKGASCLDDKGHPGPFYYCMRCDETQCENCWARRKNHEEANAGHTKTNLNDAIIVHSTIKVKLNEYRLLRDQISQIPAPAQSCLANGVSEWFGVRPENEGGGFLLTEGIAYDATMEPLWTSASKVYPGLVSFVGETGLCNRGPAFYVN